MKEEREWEEEGLRNDKGDGQRQRQRKGKTRGI